MRPINEILEEIKRIVESGHAKDLFNNEAWMGLGLELAISKGDETKKLESMRRAVALKKLHILNSQEKRNVAAAELEIEASEEYENLKNQEHLCDQVTEMIRLAKKTVDANTFN